MGIAAHASPAAIEITPVITERGACERISFGKGGVLKTDDVFDHVRQQGDGRSRSVVAPLTAGDVRRLFVDYVASRWCDVFGELLDHHKEEFVLTTTIHAKVKHELQDHATAKWVVDAFKESVHLPPKCEPDLDEILSGRRERLSQDMGIRTIELLSELGFPVVKDFVDQKGKRHRESVLPRTPPPEKPSQVVI